MPGNLDFRRLRYFVKVAELGSLTRAAEALHMAQPALSQHIRGLEDEIGAKLLARGPRGVTLTEAGQRMLEESRAMLRSAIAEVDGLALGLIMHPHPVVGEINLYEWILFVGLHEQRHLPQIGEVAAASAN